MFSKYSSKPSRRPLALDARWERQFETARLNAGRELARAGRVAELEVGNGGYEVQALVEGIHKARVRLQLQIAGGTRVSGTCSCGAKNCEHAAATLFVGLNTYGTAFSRTRQVGIEFRKQDRVPEPEPLSEDEKNKPELDLRYVLSPGKLNRGLGIRFFASPTGKDGKATQYREFDPGFWQGQFPGFCLHADDTSLIAGICGYRAAFFSRAHEIRGEEGSELFQRLLHRGKAHWNERTGPVLKQGEARRVTVTWDSDKEGAQKARLGTDGSDDVVVFDLSGGWYVVPESGQCGWATSAVPTELLLNWQNLVPIPPENAAAFCDDLRDLFPERDLPLPAVPRVRVINGKAPVPCLRFFGQSGNPELRNRPDRGETSVEDRFDGCAFSMDYGEVVAPANGQDIERWTGGEIVRVIRDRAAEDALAERLAKTGLQLAGAVNEREQTEGTPERFHGFAGNEMSIWTLGKSDPLAWTRLVLEDLPGLEAEGWRVEYDASFRYRFAFVEDWFAGAAEKGGWFAIELGVLIDNERVNLLAPLLETMRQCPDWFLPGALDELPDERAFPVALPDGRMAAMPLGRLRPVLRVLVELYAPEIWKGQGTLKVNRLRAAEVASMEGFRWEGADDLQTLGSRLQCFEKIRDVRSPAGLKAKMRPYQVHGVSWLQFLREYGLAGVLADDMGLGKTIQALAHVLIERDSGRADRPSLVVAPTSLVVNWRSEAEHFTPSLNVLILHGSDRRERFGEISGRDLVVTTYPLLVRDIDELQKVPFHLLILDEAQVVKNARTITSKAIRRLQGRHRLCLTGTPMENHLGELWSLFDFLLPGLLGDERQFRTLFRVPIEKLADTGRRETLARRVAPFLLRRTKEGIMRELPPKTEIVRPVELEGAQRDLYESIRVATHERVRAEVEANGLARSQIVILDALLKLRQVCCDPRLVKMPAAARVKQSAKLELLLGLLPEMIEEGRRVLLFSQFTSMLKLIETEVSKRGIRFSRLTGDTREREKPVQDFQDGKCPLFLISLKAGGTGLNLTAADTVIHYDPWWNPAVENQATDRAHRIGQMKPVFVYKLIASGTVEEKIAALQLRKKKLVNQLLGEAKGGKLTLTPEDLESLFEPLPAE